MLTISQLRPYVLRLMADANLRKLRDIVESVGTTANLSNDERKQQFPSGQIIINQNINDACSSFVKAGILLRLGRGSYQITIIGKEQAEKWKDAESISEKDLNELPQWNAYQQTLQERKQNNAQQETDGAENGDKEPPDSIAMRAVQEIEDQTAVAITRPPARRIPGIL